LSNKESNMDNNTNAKPVQGVGQMAEVAGNTGQVGGNPGLRPAGLYRHPQSGEEAVTFSDPLYGDAQSRAFERVGFEYIGPAPEGYVKTLGVPSASHEKQPERAQEAQAEELKGLRARLNQLEAAEATRKSQETSGQEVPGTEPVEGSEQTKEAATERVELQTGIKVDPKTGEPEREGEPNAPALGTNEGATESDKQARLKALRAEAKELGLDARGSEEDLTKRVAEAKANKEKVNG
jgi:hypothetical protein